MVDSINSAGGPQNIAAVNRVQDNKNAEQRRSERADEAQPQDEVQLSEEAQALQASQAEQEIQQTARETRTILEEQLEEALSNNRQRVDTLL